VRVALLTLGWTLLAIGVLGGLLPVIQGWPFGVAGAAILYIESRWFQRLIRRWRRRHPRFERAWTKGRGYLRARRQRRAARAHR